MRDNSSDDHSSYSTNDKHNNQRDKKAKRSHNVIVGQKAKQSHNVVDVYPQVEENEKMCCL